MMITSLLAGCIFYDCGFESGVVDVQFYPEADKENATQIMNNLSNEYNFTINYWDFNIFKYQSDDTIIKSWIASINVTVGQEKWISTEFEKNASIYRGKLRYADC